MRELDHSSLVGPLSRTPNIPGRALSNPFQKAGALLPECPSYVPRPCDVQLASALQTQSLIALQGDFGIGKSSLLVRFCKTLQNVGLVCQVDLAGTPVHDARRFNERFFASISRVVGEVRNWADIRNAVAGRSLYIMLDEFGHLSANVARRLLPDLYALANDNSMTVRVVVCLPVPMAGLLRDKCGLGNPRYWTDWHQIEVGPLDLTGVSVLLQRLPQRAHAAALARQDHIHQVCAGRPRPLQALCYDLFAAVEEGATEPSLLALIDEWRVEV